MLTVNMYAKLYGSIVGSSIWAEEDSVRLVWITMLALSDREGYVYGSPLGLARMANVPAEATIAALKKLSEPEPYSGDRLRAPENQGRRIEETESGWRLLNYLYFRDLKDAETRRAQFRESKRRSRGQSTTVNYGQPVSTDVHLSDTDTESKKKLASLAMRPRALAEVEEYWRTAVLSGDPAAFWDHFEANGWKQGGRATMKNWRAAARNWSRNESKMGTASRVGTTRSSSRPERDTENPDGHVRREPMTPEEQERLEKVKRGEEIE